MPRNSSSSSSSSSRVRSDGLSSSAIERNVEAALGAALGGKTSKEDVERRMKAASTASEAGPEFVEKYPRLLEMACGATTTEAADVVRRMLSMMLTQMAAVERGNCSEKAMDAASVVVGQVVADRYLPKNIGKDA